MLLLIFYLGISVLKSEIENNNQQAYEEALLAFDRVYELLFAISDLSGWLPSDLQHLYSRHDMIELPKKKQAVIQKIQKIISEYEGGMHPNG